MSDQPDVSLNGIQGHLRQLNMTMERFAVSVEKAVAILDRCNALAERLKALKEEPSNELGGCDPVQDRGPDRPGST